MKADGILKTGDDLIGEVTASGLVEKGLESSCKMVRLFWDCGFDKFVGSSFALC